jgi:hypothetical protein
VKKETLITALGIAILPPAWAVFAGHVGITTGAVALICAGVYVANGNKAQDAPRMSLGFVLGDAVSVLAIWLMGVLPLPSDLSTFLTLAVLGFVTVVVVTSLGRWVNLPSTLCGWAIGLAIMGSIGFANLGTLPLQIGVAMLVGVWYVGWGLDALCKRILRGRARQREELSSEVSSPCGK